MNIEQERKNNEKYKILLFEIQYFLFFVIIL